MSNLPVVKIPTNIDEVKKLVWYGDAFHDMPNFAAIDFFVINYAKSKEEAKEALNILSRDGMGIDEPCSDACLIEYIDATELVPKHYTI